MAYQVYFSRSADADIDGILEHIAQDSPTNSLQFISTLEQRIEKTLSTAPHAGSPCGDARFFAFDNYIVVYDIDEAAQAVYVHMVSEGHRQWRTIFANRS